MKLFLFFTCFFCGLFASAPLRAQEKLLICTNNYEPYYGETMPDFGPVIKITSHHLSYPGIHSLRNRYPYPCYFASPA